MPIRLTDLAFVGHPVTDVPRARAFYEQTLGLKPAFAAEIGPNRWWIEYGFPGGTLAISNAWPPAGAGTTTALETADLEEAFTHCKERGVLISSEIRDTPVCRFFEIRDPDGNELLVHQSKPQSG